MWWNDRCKVFVLKTKTDYSSCTVLWFIIVQRKMFHTCIGIFLFCNDCCLMLVLTDSFDQSWNLFHILVDLNFMNFCESSFADWSVSREDTDVYFCDYSTLRRVLKVSFYLLIFSISTYNGSYKNQILINLYSSTVIRRVTDLGGRKNQTVDMDLVVVDTQFEDNINNLYTNPTKGSFCYLGIRAKDLDNSVVSTLTYHIFNMELSN